MSEQTVRMTAKELAGAFFEEGGHSDRFHKLWPDVRVFIARNWPTFVPLARELMVAQLNDKNTLIHLKDAIFEALQEDRRREIESRSGGVKVGQGRLNLNPDHPGTLERRIFHGNK